MLMPFGFHSCHLTSPARLNRRGPGDYPAGEIQGDISILNSVNKCIHSILLLYASPSYPTNLSKGLMILCLFALIGVDKCMQVKQLKLVEDRY
jgi:hypothetical protein